jgi:hypothetical protein
MKLFDRQATRERLPLPALIDALRAAFAAGCEVPPRHSHSVGDAGTVLLMPAWREGGYLGIKTINIFPGNGALGLPALHGVYLLFDARTGVPLAQMDGGEITTRRTVAASALAASFLAPPDARRLLIVGAGRVAALTAEAMRVARPSLDDVAVWARRPDAAQALAAQIGGRAVPDLEAAVRDAHIVSCATLAAAPLVHGDWLADGAPRPRRQLHAGDARSRRTRVRPRPRLRRHRRSAGQVRRHPARRGRRRVRAGEAEGHAGATVPARTAGAPARRRCDAVQVGRHGTGRSGRRRTGVVHAVTAPR